MHIGLTGCYLLAHGVLNHIYVSYDVHIVFVPRPNIPMTLFRNIQMLYYLYYSQLLQAAACWHV